MALAADADVILTLLTSRTKKVAVYQSGWRLQAAMSRLMDLVSNRRDLPHEQTRKNNIDLVVMNVLLINSATESSMTGSRTQAIRLWVS